MGVDGTSFVSGVPTAASVLRQQKMDEVPLQKQSVLRATKQSWERHTKDSEVGSTVSADSTFSREPSLKVSAPYSPLRKHPSTRSTSECPPSDLKNCVGLALSWVNVVEDPAPHVRSSPAGRQAEMLKQPDTSECDINLDIMHTRISDTLFMASVVNSATIEQLARKFNISRTFIRSTWITSSSYVDEGESVSSCQDQQKAPKLTPNQRRRYHERLSSPVSASELSLQLSKLAVSRACISAGAELGETLSADEEIRRQRPRCGFSFARKHGDVALSCGGAIARKSCTTGLFRSVQAHSALFNEPRFGTSSRRCYVEFAVMAAPQPATGANAKSGGGRGGLCVGLATDALAANKMPGMALESIGLYASGDLILNCKHHRLGASASFDVGDVVGVLVERGSDSESSEIQVSFFVNGSRVVTTSVEVMRNARVYPTASMYHTDKIVALSCCPSDIQVSPDLLRTSMRIDSCETICGDWFAQSESETSEGLRQTDSFSSTQSGCSDTEGQRKRDSELALPAAAALSRVSADSSV
eukprot:CAMPEP_0185850922 /NCGR_PEP_ID=MMETSP1354-20130828/4862_1 /TAXON_ID=708628 /ORGANISM="Erythrolobus madagascarensis, Strain CCMP3276" /LENGTH=529 /DNA_ID=CAMNT_0028551651 /DNA_START=145 /DNA_END=1734 /DNA_ORIENTATION=+